MSLLELSRATAVAALLVACSAAVLVAKEPTQTTIAPVVPGIATEKPASGRFVEIDGAYMVPYTQTIPGTKAEFEMLPVPGGEFLLGSPADEVDRAEDEGPQVRIKVAPFWIGRTEVTWAEYKSYMAMYDAFKKLQLVAMNRAKEADASDKTNEDWQLVESHAWDGELENMDFDGVTSATPLYDSSFTFSSGEDPDQPAVTMTQFAARQYTKWLSGITGEDYRLPTEAEWEYAARAGTTGPYSFDNIDNLGQYAWFDENSDYQTHPVGQKEANPWGLHDMHGNVAEWTLDEYHEDAYEKLGKDVVAAEDAVRWPEAVFPRVIRGGSYLDLPEMLRSAARYKSEEEEWKLSDPNIPLSPWWYTEDAATGVGMRIVRPLEPIADDDEARVWDADVELIEQDVEDRLAEGRGALGVADEQLPAAVVAAEKLDKDN